MSNIIKSYIIKESDLDSQYYFQSLMEVAYQKEVINEEELNRIQIDSIDLLKRVVSMLTGNESSSIKYDRANMLLDSAYYTISVYLKSLNDLENAIKEIKSNSLIDLFSKGNNLIERYFNKYKIFYSLVKGNMLKILNYTYLNSVTSEVDNFFQVYNKDYEAHLEINIDYPLCIHPTNLTGIEFIMEYLNNFNIENLFLQLYRIEDINNLLSRLSNISSELIINIFKQVLLTTIAEELANHSEYHLYLDIVSVEMLYMNLSTKDDDEISFIIKSTINKIYAKLEVNDKIKVYIEKCLDKITDEFITSIKNDNLEILVGTKGEECHE